VKSIEKSIKSFNKEFGFIPYLGNAEKDAKFTRSFILDKWQIMKNLIPKDNLIEVTYEDLIKTPKKTIDNIKTFTGVSVI
jgi:hypothetical protein